MSYQTGQVVEVTTTDVAHGGWCVARPDGGPVVFVRHALPGETILARVTEITSRLARAEAVAIQPMSRVTTDNAQTVLTPRTALSGLPCSRIRLTFQ